MEGGRGADLVVDRHVPQVDADVELDAQAVHSLQSKPSTVYKWIKLQGEVANSGSTAYCLQHIDFDLRSRPRDGGLSGL
jgi:hypothetical protein